MWLLSGALFGLGLVIVVGAIVQHAASAPWAPAPDPEPEASSSQRDNC